jgi:hypothetical protein
MVPTVASTWQGAAGTPIADELLDWPPDVFALANVTLERSEAFRCVLSPIEEWPPRRFPGWVNVVAEAAVAWSAWPSIVAARLRIWCSSCGVMFAREPGSRSRGWPRAATKGCASPC